MKRRTLFRYAGGVTAARALSPSVGLAAPVADSEILALRQRMDRGESSAVQLVRHYLARIEALNRRGPRLGAVIEINPDALDIAAALDREHRAHGARGPLHGIPVLLKDNIATADRMSTSAGSLALAGHPAPQDSTVAARLRTAGAVILGKTNLSEWANIRSSRSTSGWSARGGFTRNPHALDRNPSGSSSGSAVAVAADLAPVAIGSETDGSIVSPSSICGVVGIKPTVGLVSRYGIVPISSSQDTAGPIARSVADAALVLAAIAGADEMDSATGAAPGPIGYAGALPNASLAGVRLGVVRGTFADNERVAALLDREVERLRSLGAVIVDPIELPSVETYGSAELEVLLYELKIGLDAYLPRFAPSAPVQSLADIIAFNDREAAREERYFAQELFVRAQAKSEAEEAAYRDARTLCLQKARDEGLQRALTDNQLHALVAVTSGPAWLTDIVNGDRDTGSFSTAAAVAGYPHVTVPAGFVADLPIGLSFVGPAFSEGRLLVYAGAYERASQHRRAPRFVATLGVG
jgi:amidase